MAAVRLAPVQAMFMSVVLLSALYVCKVSCVIQYTRWDLLNFRHNQHAVLESSTSFPKEILPVSPGLPTPWQQTGKGSRRSGVLSRFKRRPYRPPLPALLLSNVRSLRHKMDELHLLIQSNKTYGDCSAICLTETWLDHSIPDQAVSLAGYTLHRADRSVELTHKSKSCGICIMVNHRWCTNSTSLSHACSPLLEHLTVKCRPTYLPREFASIIIIGVYIPPEANANTTMSDLASHISSVENAHPDAAIIVLGDFNHTNLSTELPNYHQQVTCPSRGNNTLDHCYTPLKEAYRASAGAPLGKSDHAMLLLIPKYKQQLKSSETPIKSSKSWSTEAIEKLRGCFACTDWEVFHAAGDLHAYTDTVTSYVQFC
ncbi:hypothetical protein JOQ06_028964 [Pogonophryne albipinna]|uniref:Endonuclease/exonuclease/phosphatase domain-containing protein n=1 Tax=Pogonophryne albipinna TaxID=1090488 RepID=A0AAD6B7G1_9TELE|nr:hypothetical protein JOQ06_028964 [Pogonophryne albipinna]